MSEAIITKTAYAELEKLIDSYVAKIRKGSSARVPVELTGDTRQLSEEDRLRVLRLELELQHTKEAHARDFAQLKEEHAREREHWQQRQSADRDNFRLQIENLILRLQRGLPPPELPEKPEDE